MYPEPVIEISNFWVSNLTDSFFTDNDIQPNDVSLSRKIASEKFEEFFFNKFLKGEELLFNDDESCADLLNDILIACYIDSLRRKGYIGIYEDENTPEMVYITSKGKELLTQKIN